LKIARTAFTLSHTNFLGIFPNYTRNNCLIFTMAFFLVMRSDLDVTPCPAIWKVPKKPLALDEPTRLLVGINCGFSFPMRYFDPQPPHRRSPETRL